MIRLLKADFLRLVKSTVFRFSLLGSLTIGAFLMFTQATAMDYTVPLSRVVFLPLSLLPVVMAVLVSVFIGNDFSDGVIRNKLMATDNRRSLVYTYFIVSGVACLCCYLFVTLFSVGIGQLFFENNIKSSILLAYFVIGMLMSLAFACLYSMIVVLIGNKTSAVIVNMVLSFCMLFLSMQLNSILVQNEYKNGALNPHYVSGIRRAIYMMIQDMNPYGQAAQLSSWNVINPLRCMACSFVIITLSVLIGWVIFERKDIN